jgi:hypothetical protein
VFAKGLVLNPSDNGYLYLPVAGVALAPPAIAFALSALLPWRAARLSLWYAGRGMLWLSGVLGVLLMAAALVIVAFFALYADPALLAAHLAGLALLAGTLYVIGVRMPRAGEGDTLG